MPEDRGKLQGGNQIISTKASIFWGKDPLRNSGKAVFVYRSLVNLTPEDQAVNKIKTSDRYWKYTSGPLFQLATALPDSIIMFLNSYFK